MVTIANLCETNTPIMDKAMVSLSGKCIGKHHPYYIPPTFSSLRGSEVDAYDTTGILFLHSGNNLIFRKDALWLRFKITDASI